MRRLVLGCALLLTLSARARADERPSLAYPDVPTETRARVGVGMTVDVLPRSLVESEIRQVPKAVVTARATTPFGLYALGRLSANVLANELSASAGYARELGPVAVAVHERVAFWLGYVGVSGFDTTAWGLMTMPGASVGVRTSSGFRVTARFELLLVHAQHVQLPGATIERKRFVVAGGSLGITVEDRAGETGLLYYGVTATLASPDYQLWLAFSDVDRKRVYPTLFAGYAF